MPAFPQLAPFLLTIEHDLRIIVILGGKKTKVKKLFIGAVVLLYF